MAAELESAAIRVTCSDQAFHYDLRWYTADFIVPVWWMGVSDPETGELDRTEVLHPESQIPGEVFRWLVPSVGQDVARRLVSLAAADLVQICDA